MERYAKYRLDDAMMLKRLAHPKDRVRMILDTDAFNEVDDQFALAYSLLSPDKLDLLAVTAAPFFNWNSTSPGEGMEKSYNEIFNIYKLMELEQTPPVYRGSAQFMNSVDEPVPSEAVDRIIELALSAGEEPLYVVAIGAITNVASAIAKCPEIIRSIVVVWLGPNSYWWPTQDIFNLSQDYHASRIIYDSGVPLVILPCHSVASHLLTTTYEIDACLRGRNKLGTYFSDLFHGRFERFGRNRPGWSKVLWDVSAIAWLLSEEWVPSIVRRTPILNPNFTYSSDDTRHFYKEAIDIDRSLVYIDLFEKLSKN
ncbi:inosine-uridine nucleoside N-ribohydrolase [Paenibacillus taihuensis]|uniref:Inosine-uridine nucleoside N-ribohydrolase n=1 Tax=Paenibacillus taihuensis TaxID=1156355 RepID=A0A3D9QU42_9BACL|nr:nucleoside hydrolase [Paenibacillus taihuensis]REE67291.1 inosine-uridine nucleoside N-ribohydrolase [Paenibacillus taihuensis]